MQWHPNPSERRRQNSLKWSTYPETEIPLWVADMDCSPPSCVKETIQNELIHGIYGYGIEPPGFREAWVIHLAERHQWDVDSDWIVPVPGVVPGMRFSLLLNPMIVNIFAPTPCYSYFKTIPDCAEKNHRGIMLEADNGILTTSLDTIEARFKQVSGQSLMLWCNPQNPGGTVYGETFVAGLSAICHEHNITLVSDEIWADLIRTNATHAPLGKYADQTHRTITLMAATKTFNIAGFPCAIAIIPNDKLRASYLKTLVAMPHVSPLGYKITESVLRHGWVWHSQLLDELRKNHQQIETFQILHPELRLITGDSSFLAWLSHREGHDDLDLQFARENVRLSPGNQFGDPTSVRLNFGCSPITLSKALSRMDTALKRINRIRR